MLVTSPECIDPQKAISYLQVFISSKYSLKQLQFHDTSGFSVIQIYPHYPQLIPEQAFAISDGSLNDKVLLPQTAHLEIDLYQQLLPATAHVGY